MLNEAYAADTTDFAPLINKIVAADADVLVGGGHFADGSTLARQLYDKKTNLTFTCLQVAPANPKFATLGSAAYGVATPTQWAVAAKYAPDFGPTVTQFIDAYKKKYGAPPDGYHAAGGYAAGLILQQGVKKAGTADTAAVAKALNHMNATIFYGDIRFASETARHGLQIDHKMLLMQWQKGPDGKLVNQVVWPESARTAPVILMDSQESASKQNS